MKLDKDMAVLVYLDGRKSLASSCQKALQQLEDAGGSNESVDLVVQSTLEPTLRERFQGVSSQPTQRLHVHQGSSQVLEESTESTPLTQQSLAEFVAWGTKKYPAKKTVVVVKTHGAGFAGAAAGVPLSAHSLKEALQTARQQTGRSIDVLALDACSTQQLELAYELKDQALVLTGASEDIYAANYPYFEILLALKREASPTPERVGQLIVEANRGGKGLTSQSAVSLSEIGKLGRHMREFHQSVLDHRIEPALLYTQMVSSRSQEPGETSRLQYNFRDLGGFLAGVVGDERFPAGVRQRAQIARESLDKSLIARFASPSTQRLKAPTGLSAVLTWKQLEGSQQAEYQALDYVRESRWDEVCQRVFQARVPAQEQSESPLPLWKIPLKHYKKYVSGHLGVACPYTPSCSQYAREAVETHGFLRGSWLGLIRLMSCNHRTQGGSDPVAGAASPQPTHHHSSLVAPPNPSSNSLAKRALVIGAGLAGAGIGALVGALALLPLGVAAGGYFGYQAGADQMDQVTEKFWRSQLEQQQAKLSSGSEALAANHAEAAAQGMLRMARPLGKPGLAIHDRVLSLSQSPRAAALVGAPGGALAGCLKGAMAGAAAGGAIGARFGYLWGSGLAKEKLGELPPNPHVQAILENFHTT